MKIRSLLAALVAGVLVASAVTPSRAAETAQPFVVNVADVSGGAGTAGVMDLTSYGDLDWVHVAGSGTERKAGVTPAITVENLGSGLDTLSDSPLTFRWSDGATPGPGVTTGGVYQNTGYRITVAPANELRRLVFIGGIWQARGTVTVTSGSSSYVTKVTAGGSASVKRYTVTIRPGQGIVVTGNITEKVQPFGNLSLSAAALSTAGPFTVSTPPTTMNLTAEGPSDWLHLDGTTLNRPEGGALSVVNQQTGGTIGAQNDNPVTYAWTNGVPTKEQPGTRQGGIFFGKGYELTIPAAATARTVRFVSGAWRAVAEVSVSVNGAPRYVNTDLTSTDAAVTRLYEVRLAAGESARIDANILSTTHDSGNVTLAGVTVAETGSKQLLQNLLAQIAATDVSAASEAAVQQLDREVQLATDYSLLKAAYDEAVSSAANAAYTSVTNPGLTSSFGWEGDLNAPIAFIDGSYKLRSRGNTMVTFGVPEIPGKIKWTNAEGYLPAFVSEYAKDGLAVKITNFADAVVVGGNRFEIAYSRMAVKNTTAATKQLPRVSTALTPLTETPATVEPGQTVVRDYAIAADRFGASYDWPTTAQLKSLGGFDKHYAHMRQYWNKRLAAIADITDLPDQRLVNAYKAGFIYTLIIRDDINGAKELHVGENGYDEMFDHDTIGIVSTLLTIGDFTYAKDYLSTLPAQLQYDDAKWKYSWPYALYLQRTGDKAFIRERFETIKKNTHTVETDRIDGGTGIIKQTYAIDSLGYWTIDNWSALTGLTTYRYLATALGETAEAAWAKAEYDDLLRVATARIEQTQREFNLDYLPISMVEPNETGPRKDPRDANWASMFLFGRWAWDGYLFGAEQSGTMLDQIDATYTHGFDRRKEVSDTIYNFGGYPHGYFSSAYNAGYGSSALRGEQYRDLGIKAYQFMIDKAQSGPFGWWEGVDYPSADSPWSIDHARGGGGSNQHMWGQSTATKVLFDSLIAEKSDGTIIIGRGVPNEWIRTGQKIGLKRYPARNGSRVGYDLTTTGRRLDIRFTGPSTTYSLELPALRNNVASVSVRGAVVDQAAGVVRLPHGTSHVRIALKR